MLNNKFASLVTIAQQSKLGIFEYLFAMAQKHTNKLYDFLEKELKVDIDNIFNLFLLCSMKAELTLIEQILHNSHPIQLIHCGATHAENVINYLAEYPGIQYECLDMLDPKMQDPEYCYKAMEDFIFKKLT
jgi:hypothetical protein